MRNTFPTIALDRVHRWGGAALVVVARDALDAAPHCSPRAVLSVPSVLSRAERHVFDALPPWRQAEWWAGRLTAKRLVAEVTGTPVTSVEILPRADGSPRLTLAAGPGGRPRDRCPHLTISHTAHHVAVALAPGPVGVDVCETASAGAVRRAADHVLSPAERRLVPDGAGFLTAAWALKEAAVKAERRGLAGEAPRRVRLLGLTPPALDGPRRALVRRAGTAVLALVLAPDPEPAARQRDVPKSWVQ
ncbi:4'-phosphopantetheinyl transferase family protein [Streptomyces sp. NPDC004065]|uniref:4'-phosphopantetheinyl transferase family protein n=1 Tax=Streptomyces sp. NPDC004065 TaxID=3364689 RepID=UPI0038517CDB